MKKSKFLQLNYRDLAEGFAAALVGGFLTAVMATIERGDLPTLPELKQAGHVALIAAIGMLLRQLLQNSEGQKLKRERKTTYNEKSTQ